MSTATIESRLLVSLVARFGTSKLRFQVKGQEHTSPLPKLYPLRTIPNVLSQGGVALAMRSVLTKEGEEGRVKDWARALGLWCSVAFNGQGRNPHLDEVGKMLDGTNARAAWDLESEAQGVRAAIIGLAIETADALACWREGFEEGTRLQCRGMVK